MLTLKKLFERSMPVQVYGYLSQALVILLLAFLVGCGGRSSDADEQEINQAPIINIDANFDVNENESISLSAQISDQDGQVNSISWLQLSGQPVTLSTSSQASTSFVAPEVAVDSQLVFEVSATDNDGETTSVQVTVTVLNVSGTTPSFTVGGSVSGLSGLLELSLNSSELLSISRNGNFTFATEIAPNQDYMVAVSNQPSSQICQVLNGVGTAYSNVEDVLVTCSDTQISQCNDGIDNDLDGLADWQQDLGCTSQSDSSEGGLATHALENGWSVFEPSLDTVIYFVSSSDGNDELNDGLSSEQPFQTYSKALSMARDEHPDWILLKRGDTFYESILVKSGRNSNEPFVVSSYGESTIRPLIKVGASNGIDFELGFSYVAVIGLDFYAHTRNPEDADYVDSNGGYGFRIWRQAGQRGNDVLIENSAFRYFVLSVSQGPDAPENITLRRNLFEYNYSTNSHSQGIYSRGTINLVFEENIMDHNGWLIQSFDDGQSEGQATKFNHNTYFNSIDGLTYRGNAIMRGASMGSKFTAQTIARNLNIEDNLYLDNEIGIGMGQNYDHPYRFNQISVIDNVFVKMGESRPTNRTLGWGIQLDGLDDGSISQNYVVDSDELLVQNIFALEIFPGQNELSIEDNVIHGISASNNRGLLRLYGDDSQQLVTLTNNKIIAENSLDVLLESDESSFENILFESNSYFSLRDFDAWFEMNNEDMSFQDWLLETNEQGASDLLPNFCEASRTIESYQASLQEVATKESFIENIKKQGKFHWDQRYEVNAVNQWIKSGFTLCH